MAGDETHLWSQYEHALDEYRFQVRLNWDRTKYLLTLELAVGSAGTGLLGIEGVNARLVGAVFVVGATVAGLAVVTLHTQRNYYRRARELKAAIEAELELNDFAIRTTPGMDASSDEPDRGRFMTVHAAQLAVFGLLFCLHVIGAVVAF